MSVAPVAYDESPEQVIGEESREAKRERWLYGGFGILLAIVIYIPLQIKVDARITQLTRIEMPPGLSFSNILLVVALIKYASVRKQPVVRPSGHVTFLTTAITLFALATVVSFFVSLFYGSPAWMPWTDFAYYCKSAVAMMLSYAFARRFVHSETHVRYVIYAMAAVVTFAAWNLLRENFDGGMNGAYRENLRFGGIFDWGGQNDLGAFLGEFIFIPMALMFYEKKLVRKLAFAFAVVVTGIGCLFTYSRGAWLGMLVGSIFYFIRRKPMLLFIPVLAIPLAFTIPSVQTRWDMTEDERTGTLDPSAEGRLTRLDDGLVLIREHPLLGVGINRFKISVPWTGHATEAHNTFLKIAAEQGLPTLLLFIVILLLSVTLTFNTQPGIERELAIAFFAAWAAFIPINLLGNRFIREGLTCYYWLILGILAWFRTQYVQKLSEPETE